jgi:hypothetical protein
MLHLKSGPHNTRSLANEAIRLDVTSLIQLYGDAAFTEACERARRAQARGDRTEKLIWTQVALKVRHRTFADVPTLIVQADPEQRAKMRKPRPAKRPKPCCPSLAHPVQNEGRSGT